jgi:hypothetical protein
MASVVDIANLALAHLGDEATIASLYPPEGSAQAEHAARFYPIARDSLLELHPWNFGSKRVKLVKLATNESTEWTYCYMLPTDVLSVVAVMPPDATDDYSAHIPQNTAFGFNTDITDTAVASAYVPQPFQVEVTQDGSRVIRTDQDEAHIRYNAFITDPTTFSPLFVTTLSWHLASMLAGPVLKGDAGAAESKRCAQMAAVFLSQAKISDTEQRKANPRHIVSWMVGR